MGQFVAIRLRAGLPAGAKLRRYRVDFGDGVRRGGRRLPTRLRHIYRRSGTYWIRATFTGTRRRTTRARLRVVVRKTRSTAPTGWVTIEPPVAHNDQALLINVSEGAYNALYRVVATRTAGDYTLRPGQGLPPGAKIDADTFRNSPVTSATLSPPLPNHPSGVVVVVLSATTRAQGLTPADQATYAELYDAASGNLLANVKLTLPPNWYLPDPIGYDGRTLAVTAAQPSEPGFLAPSQEMLAHIDPQGRVVAAVPMPGLPGQSSLGAVSGSVAVIFQESSSEKDAPCPMTFVYDLPTLTEVRHGPCGFVASVALPGGAYAVYTPQQLLSLSDGRVLTDATALGNPSDPRFTSGPRSSLIAEYDDEHRGPANFISTVTWQIVHSVDTAQALRLEVYGMADDAAWVQAGGQHLVIDGHTGAVLANDWAVYPWYGGDGWTVVGPAGATNGTPPAYLYRGRGRLVDHLDGAPVR